jgi:hypothetical protein
MNPPRTPKRETEGKKDGTLECPCCGAKLLFDPLRQSLRSAAPGVVAGKDMDFAQAVSALRSEKARADEKFREAFAQEGRRKASLEKKFEDSLKEAGDSGEPPPIRPFDLD